MSDATMLVDTSREYFLGERREMIAILISAGVAILIAFFVLIRLRDGFAAGFAFTVIIAAVLLGGTAFSLLKRDGPMLTAMTVEAQSGAVAAVREREIIRITTIIEKYPIYHRVALALGMIAIVLAAFVSLPAARGVAAGLLLLVAAQFIIDHYSESRARLYESKLGTMLQGAFEP